MPRASAKDGLWAGGRGAGRERSLGTATSFPTFSTATPGGGGRCWEKSAAPLCFRTDPEKAMESSQKGCETLAVGGPCGCAAPHRRPLAAPAAERPQRPEGRTRCQSRTGPFLLLLRLCLLPSSEPNLSRARRVRAARDFSLCFTEHNRFVFK